MPLRISHLFPSVLKVTSNVGLKSLSCQFYERLPNIFHCKTIHTWNNVTEFVPAFTRKYLSKSPESFYRSDISVCLYNDSSISESRGRRRPADLSPDQADMLIFEELTSKLNSQSVCSMDDWKYLHEAVPISDSAFGARVLSFCIENKCFSLGKSYMDYLERCNINLSFLVLARYIRLCGECSNEVQEDYVLNLVHKLKQMIRAFDSRIASDVIVGLASTSQWRDCLAIMNESKILSKPSATVYSAIIMAAYKNKDFSLTWNLMHQLLHSHDSVNASFCIDWIDMFKEFRESDKMRAEEHMIILLNYLGRNNFQLPDSCCEEIRNWFLSQNNWRGEYVSIPPDGKCCHCESGLKSSEDSFTQTEFDVLKDYFLNQVIIGTNVFENTNPKELDTFKKFVSATSPYHYVLDGLNVEYYQHPAELIEEQRVPWRYRGKQLSDVVRELAANQKKVLVVGKKHILNWHPQYLYILKQNAYLFLLDKFSLDDIYVLYAAMHSGLGTKVISRDLMRDHKAKLKNQKMINLFIRWHLLHQLQQDKIDGKIELLDPVSYDTTLQLKDNTIHIPCSTTENLEKSLYPPEKWLCITQS